LGNEVTFSSDISAFDPQVTPLADGSFILAWQNETDIFARFFGRSARLELEYFQSARRSDTRWP
jgi:hypothetical protein